MRRRWQSSLPALAEQFGVRPFDIERLTPLEFLDLVARVTPRPGG